MEVPVEGDGELSKWLQWHHFIWQRIQLVVAETEEKSEDSNIRAWVTNNRD